MITVAIREPTTSRRERGGTMRAHQINRGATWGLILLSLVALMTVLPVAFRGLLGGSLPPPEADEGTAAHIFQLSIVTLLPTGLLFLATADWERPWRIVRSLVVPAVAVVAAFALLYYIEHYYPSHHPRAAGIARAPSAVVRTVGFPYPERIVGIRMEPMSESSVQPLAEVAERQTAASSTP